MRESARIPRSLGEHEVVRLIARGGMGAVYEVVSRRTGARAAAKTILRTRDPAARQRFAREAELLARCDRHPGIVAVHSFGETEAGEPYMILDLVTGEGLDARLAREGPLEPRAAASLALEVARALAFVHERGVVHRDVKPSNILLDGATGAARLTDFGLATARDLERLTKTGAFLGTVSYCAPEQAQGGRVGPATDVFSLGAVLFHALANEPPIDAPSAVEHLIALQQPTPVRDVRSVNSAVPDALARIVARALAKDPGSRHPGGAELARDLERFLAGEPIGGETAGPLAGKRRLALAGGLLAAAAALGVLVLVRGREPTGPATGAAPTRTAAEPQERARAALEGGSPRGALDVLDGAPPAASPAAAAERRLLRARALLALGRAADARKDAEAALADLPEARRAEAYEVAGDACALTSAFPAAADAYARALRLGPRSPETVRAKRGATAVRAGDDRAALADLAALVPDPSKLSADRAANAALAGFAPALYRRGLASAGSREAHERDLEAAWRLADPPPELTATLARRFRELVLPERAFGEFLALGPPSSDAALDARCHELAILGRALALDPYSPELWEPLATFRQRYSANNTDVSRVLEHAVAACPTLPTVTYLMGRTLAPGAGRPFLERAAAALPAFRADEPPELRTLAGAIALAWCERDLAPTTSAVPDGVSRLAERPLEGPTLAALAGAHRRRLNLGRARALVDRALARSDAGPEAWAALGAIHLDEGDPAGARDVARKAAAALAGTTETDVWFRILIEARRFDELAAVDVDALDTSAPGSGDLFERVVRALLLVGRFGPARRMAERLRSAKPDQGDALLLACSGTEILGMQEASARGEAADAARIAREAYRISGPRAKLVLTIGLKLAHLDAELIETLDPAHETELYECGGLCDSFVHLHRYAEARALARRIESSSPRLPLEVEFKIAMEDGRRPDAEALARRFPDCGSTYAGTAHLLTVLERETDPEKKEAAIREILELTSRGELALGWGLLRRTTPLLQTGGFAEAARAFERLDVEGELGLNARAARKEAPSTVAGRVDALLARGKRDAALDLARAFDASPFAGPESHDLLARVLKN